MKVKACITCPSNLNISWEPFHKLYCPLVPIVGISLTQCLHINLTFFHMQRSQSFTSVHQTSWTLHTSSVIRHVWNFPTFRPRSMKDVSCLPDSQRRRVLSRTHTRKYSLWAFYILCTSTVSEEGAQAPWRSLWRSKAPTPCVNLDTFLVLSGKTVFF